MPTNAGSRPTATIKLSMRAVIAGIEFLDVVQYVSNWALNQIPTATLVVAVGKNMADDKLATIHGALDSLVVQQQVEIYFKAIVINKEEPVHPGVPDGPEKLVFFGDLAGIGYRRTEKGAQFIIHVLHWLGRLDYSSAISATSHPGNPADWTYPAVFRGMGLSTASAAGGTPGNLSWVPTITDNVSAGDLEDLWGNIFFKWIKRVASEDPFDRNLLLNTGIGDGDPLIRDAIRRMGPNAAEGMPLQLKADGVGADVIARAIQLALSNEQGSSWVNTTLWGKLVGELAPAYWFSIVPRVEDALIVPFTGGLQGRTNYWATITVDDHHQAELTSNLPRALRAVGIVHPVGFATGMDTRLATSILERGGCCGLYHAPNVRMGLIMLKDAPRWLSSVLMPTDFTFFGTGNAGNNEINAVVDNAQAGAIGNGPQEITTRQQGVRTIMSHYAHQWFVIESLKGRIGEISGKLRFDIAPGSNVRIETGRSRNINIANDQLVKRLYATVMAVSYVIDAEAHQAGTAFTLAHVRTAAENLQEGTSVPGPPLYQKAWKGAVLLKGVVPDQ